MIYTWCEQNTSAAITTIAQYSTEYLDSVALNCNRNELHKMLYLPRQPCFAKHFPILVKLSIGSLFIFSLSQIAHQEISIRKCENWLQNNNWTISTRTDAAPILVPWSTRWWNGLFVRKFNCCSVGPSTLIK